MTLDAKGMRAPRRYVSLMAFQLNVTYHPKGFYLASN